MEKDPIQIHFKTNGNASIGSKGRTGNGGGCDSSVRKRIIAEEEEDGAGQMWQVLPEHHQF